MAGTEFSKGPWKTNLPTRSDGAIIVGHVVDANEIAVAQLSHHSDALITSNANLIAAAPTMLAALERAELAVAELCVGQDPANECWNIGREIQAAILMARAA